MESILVILVTMIACSFLGVGVIILLTGGVKALNLLAAKVATLLCRL